jgi:hypothetical protein
MRCRSFTATSTIFRAAPTLSAKATVETLPLITSSPYSLSNAKSINVQATRPKTLAVEKRRICWLVWCKRWDWVRKMEAVRCHGELLAVAGLRQSNSFALRNACKRRHLLQSIDSFWKQHVTAWRAVALS